MCDWLGMMGVGLRDAEHTSRKVEPLMESGTRYFLSVRLWIDFLYLESESHSIK